MQLPVHGDLHSPANICSVDMSYPRGFLCSGEQNKALPLRKILANGEVGQWYRKKRK